MATRTSPRRLFERGRHAAPSPPKKKPARKKKQRGFFRRFWWVFAAVPLVFVVGLIATFLYVYAHTEIPGAPPPAQTTYVYDRNGQLITTLHGQYNRTEVPLAEMPKSLREAAIATEDKDFYHHGGVSFTAIFRAAWQDLIHRRVEQGGSTITQQYVKNVYTGGERSLLRKVKEAILAMKLEKKYTKNQILEKYLNTIYFGHGAYGVQAAAQTYFGVDSKDLSILQSATLAGLIAAPSKFDPIANESGAYVRRNYVLDRMVEEGYITRQKAAELKTRPVVTVKEEEVASPAVYFMDYTRQWLYDRYGEEQTLAGGLRVTTTLDLKLQRIAQRVVHDALPKKHDPPAALVAIDPRDGGVVAMVGGKNPTKLSQGLNLASGGVNHKGRPAGSAFKVFTLSAAMDQHFDLDSIWEGPSEITIDDKDCYSTDPDTGDFGPWTLSNYADESAGTMTLLDATANSVNTIFAQLVTKLKGGPQDVVDVAHEMGIQSDLKPVCSITLGTQDVTPLEMARGYATLANRGTVREAVPVESVSLPDGTLLEDVKADHHRALAQNDADLVTYALQRVVMYGTGTAADLGERPVAGKTGTGQNYSDAWFCGYIPQLVTCVWVGYPQGTVPLEDIEGYPQVFGGSIPASIWHDFMEQATEGMKVVDFTEPDFEGYDKGPEGEEEVPTYEPQPVETSAPLEPTETPAPTETPSPTPSPTPKETPSPTPSLSTAPEPSETPSVSPSPEPTTTPAPVPTSPLPTVTATPTAAVLRFR